MRETRPQGRNAPLTTLLLPSSPTYESRPLALADPTDGTWGEDRAGVLLQWVC